jgi:hypothetical protein
MRLAIVGPLALGVGVVNEEAEASPRGGGRPLQHLHVTVGIAERGCGSFLLSKYSEPE